MSTTQENRRTIHLFISLAAALGCSDEPMQPVTPLTVYPNAGVVLDHSSLVVPAALVDGQWVLPDHKWCVRSEDTSLVTFYIFRDPLTDNLRCALLAGQRVGSTVVHFKLGRQTSTVAVSVQPVWMVTEPADDQSWISSFSLGSPSVGYFSMRSEGSATGSVYRWDLTSNEPSRAPVQFLDHGWGGAVVLNAAATVANFAVGRRVVRVNTSSNTPIDTIVTDTAGVGAVYSAVMGEGDSVLFIGMESRLTAVNVGGTAGLAFSVITSGRLVHVAMTPDGRRMFATVQAPGGTPRHVVEFDPTTGVVLDTLPLDTLVQGIAVSPDGQRIFVGNEDGTLYSCVIVTPLCQSIRFPPRAWSLAVSRDGQTLYVSSGETGYLNLSGGGIAVYDVATMRLKGWVQLKGPARRVVSGLPGTYVLSGATIVRLPLF